jgi:hypothetical protein
MSRGPGKAASTGAYESSSGSDDDLRVAPKPKKKVRSERPPQQSMLQDSESGEDSMFLNTAIIKI